MITTLARPLSNVLHSVVDIFHFAGTVSLMIHLVLYTNIMLVRSHYWNLKGHLLKVKVLLILVLQDIIGYGHAGPKAVFMNQYSRWRK